MDQTDSVSLMARNELLGKLIAFGVHLSSIPTMFSPFEHFTNCWIRCPDHWPNRSYTGCKPSTKPPLNSQAICVERPFLSVTVNSLPQYVHGTRLWGGFSNALRCSMTSRSSVWLMEEERCSSVGNSSKARR